MTVKAQKKNNMAFKLKSGNKPPFKILGSTPNIKERLDRKYGLGDYAIGGTKQRMLPGESEYQYNIRMKRLNNQKTKNDYTEEEKRFHAKMSDDLAEKDDPMFDEPGYIQGVHGSFAPKPKGDLRKDVELPNFGITDTMSFGEAFKQAGKAGAKIGDIFDYKGTKILYDFKDNKVKKEPTIDNIPSYITQVPQFKDLTLEQYRLNPIGYQKGAENFFKNNPGFS